MQHSQGLETAVGRFSARSVDGTLVRLGMLWATLAVACTQTPATSAAPSADAGSGDAAATDSADVAAAQDSATDAAVQDVEPADVPDSVGFSCNPILQDCPDPTLDCAFMHTTPGYAAICVVPNDPGGGGAEGESCAGTLENNDCARGLDCSHGEQAKAFVCRKFCAKDSQCDADQRCASVTQVGKPYFGICLPSCDLFGSDCPTGTTCSAMYLNVDQSSFLVTCRPIGPGAAGASCKVSADCGAGMACQGKNGFHCTPLCNAGHPCGTGACTPKKGVPDQGGLCL
jgi:hypothetical protein